MVSIGIAGASGCGKSHLVRQLSALNDAPAFLEGEQGFFPPEVIKEISYAVGNKAPLKLFRFFTAKLDARLSMAKRLSGRGVLSFVEGCVDSASAYLVLEKPKFHPILRKDFAPLRTDADCIVLLICSARQFERNIRARGRPHELTKRYIARSMRVQKEFLSLLRKKKNVLVLRRENLDFSDYSDLQRVNKRIQAFVAKASRKNVKRVN